MDSIRLHLIRREVGQHVIEGGLDYLVARWSRRASDLASRTEAWTWEEWLNDLDTREILQDLLDHVPTSRVALPKIEDADARFLGAATETAECQWGAENATRHGWTREKNWWYWRKPLTPYA